MLSAAIGRKEPLKFHYVFLFTLLPLNVLSLLYELYYLMFRMSAFHAIYFFFDLTAVLLLVVTFYGLLKRKRIGVFGLLAVLTLMVFQTVWQFMFIDSQGEGGIWEMFLTAAKTGIIAVYYYKRRRYFQ